MRRGTVLAGTVSLALLLGACGVATQSDEAPAPLVATTAPTSSEPSASVAPFEEPTEKPSEESTSTSVDATVEQVPGSEFIPNYDELVADATLTKGEYDTVPDAYLGFEEQFNKMLNFQPTEEELASMEGFVSEETGATGRLAVHEAYLSAFSNMFLESSNLSRTMEEVSKTTFERWYQTRDEEHPYRAWWTYENADWTFSDNSLDNSLPDEPFSAVYNFPFRPIQTNLTFDNKNVDDTWWYWTHQATFVKLGEVPATPSE